jgi:hypothetical protein
MWQQNRAATQKRPGASRRGRFSDRDHPSAVEAAERQGDVVAAPLFPDILMGEVA